MYDRVKEWYKFAEQVHRHIASYTLTQYGSEEGTEQVENFTEEDCWVQIQRYYNRRKASARGDTEQLSDLLKVAHYAQFIFTKKCKKLGVKGVY